MEYDKLYLAISILVLTGSAGCAQMYAVALPGGFHANAEVLKKTGVISKDCINEASGLVRSTRYDDVFWTLNDSGGKPEIFPIHADGQLIRRPGSNDCGGIQVSGAQNTDWEAITIDSENTLYIADSGNNLNDCRDLVVYVLLEPDPYTDSSVQVEKKYRFRYPDQSEFPARSLNFDAEAIFVRNGVLYILTKHRTDKNTTLYRFDMQEAEHEQQLEKITSFFVDGECTDAALAHDETMLAVLTYGGVWIHDLKSVGQHNFKGQRYWKAVMGKQLEGMSFSGQENDRLTLINEQGELFTIPLHLQSNGWHKETQE